MRAVVRSRYGSPDVLELQEVEVPMLADDGVLVRVHAASVNRADWYALTGTPLVGRTGIGLLRPKERGLGTDFAGTVDAVGKDVSQFRPGDEVFGGRDGAFAEYVSVREGRAIVSKPANVTFEEAAAVPVAALTALQGLRDKGQVQPGQKVLINGASGGVGTFAVQIAKALGAEVTGVCSTGNVDLVRSIGADHVIDYTREDFTHPATYDLVFDTVGKGPFLGSLRSLKKGGVYLSAVALVPIARKLWASLAGKRMIGGITKPKTEDLVFLKDLIEAGKLRAVIDRRYPLEQIAEAHRYVDQGHKKGNVVITLDRGLKELHPQDAGPHHSVE